MAYADPADQRAAVQRHYEANKQYYVDKAKRQRDRLIAEIQALKHNKPCTDCGVPYPFYVMHFDHLEDKVAGISILMRRGSSAQVRAEIAKCELVCANCHAIRTWNRSQQLKIDMPS